jgi:hypothetical protein
MSHDPMPGTELSLHSYIVLLIDGISTYNDIYLDPNNTINSKWGIALSQDVFERKRV